MYCIASASALHGENDQYKESGQFNLKQESTAAAAENNIQFILLT